MKLPIRPAGAPTRRGPYSPGIVTNGRLLFTANQLPIDPATNELIEGDIDAHAHQAMVNLLGVIEAAGGRVEGVVKVNLYLADIADAPRVNEVYATTFSEPYPARTATQSSLPRGARVEIDAVVSLD